MTGLVVISVVISIVSHGHGALALRLLGQLAELPAGTVAGVVLTLNAPKLDDGLLIDARLAATLNLQVLRNTEPLGFGANHNRAFKAARQNFAADNVDVFCVVNPDIELPDDGVLAALLAALAQPRVGLAFPDQVDGQGRVLDFERSLTTPRAILLRRLGLGSRTPAGAVDWVNGAFMAFRADVYAGLGGFDERYFMYCEDVDICLRLQLAGYTLAKADAVVVHHTRRRTLKNLKHLAWHLRSLLRLWRSSAYHAYVGYMLKKKN